MKQQDDLRALNKSDAARLARASIEAFLSRLRHRGREPDQWEAHQLMRAITLVRRREHVAAINAVGLAIVPPVADATAFTAVQPYDPVPALFTLEALFADLCSETSQAAMH